MEEHESIDDAPQNQPEPMKPPDSPKLNAYELYERQSLERAETNELSAKRTTSNGRTLLGQSLTQVIGMQSIDDDWNRRFEEVVALPSPLAFTAAHVRTLTREGLLTAVQSINNHRASRSDEASWSRGRRFPLHRRGAHANV